MVLVDVGAWSQGMALRGWCKGRGDSGRRSRDHGQGWRRKGERGDDASHSHFGRYVLKMQARFCIVDLSRRA